MARCVAEKQIASLEKIAEQGLLDLQRAVTSLTRCHTLGNVTGDGDGIPDTTPTSLGRMQDLLFTKASDNKRPAEAGLFLHQFTNISDDDANSAWAKFMVTQPPTADLSLSAAADVFFGLRDDLFPLQRGRIRSYTFWSAGTYYALKSTTTTPPAFTAQSQLFEFKDTFPPFKYTFPPFFIFNPYAIEDPVPATVSVFNQDFKNITLKPVIKCGYTTDAATDERSTLCPSGYTPEPQVVMTSYYDDIEKNPHAATAGNNEWVLSEFNYQKWKMTTGIQSESAEQAKALCNKAKYPILGMGIVMAQRSPATAPTVSFVVVHWLCFNLCRADPSDQIPLMIMNASALLKDVFEPEHGVETINSLFSSAIPKDAKVLTAGSTVAWNLLLPNKTYTVATFLSALQAKAADLLALQSWLEQELDIASTGQPWLYKEIKTLLS